MTWLHGRGKPWTFDLSFRTSVAESIKGVVTRAETLACKLEREQVGVYWIVISIFRLTSHD
jgi:transformation/transcription domain-associated protein